MQELIAPLQDLKRNVQTVIVGQDALIDRLLIAFLAGGHVLLEGPPGLAKTTTVHTLATAIGASFQRIQFTPDLMPSDLTGSEIFDAATGSFRFVSGPLFHEIILADEINRAPPKVQSALLEAMAEQQITVAGKTHTLPTMFMVLATQNPIEQAGTYALPEAQLDRFMFKLVLDYPTVEEEVEISRRARKVSDHSGAQALQAPCLTPQMLMQLRQHLASIHIEPALERYAVEIVAATRDVDQHSSGWGGYVTAGASPRASIALIHASMARAALTARDYVIPEDIIAMAPDILRHRILLHFSAQVDGIDADRLIDHLLKSIPTV